MHMTPTDLEARSRVREALYAWLSRARATGLPDVEITHLLIEFVSTEIIQEWQRQDQEHPMSDRPTTKPTPTPPAKPAPKPQPPERDRPERPAHPITDPDDAPRPIPHDDAPTQADI